VLTKKIIILAPAVNVPQDMTLAIPALLDGIMGSIWNNRIALAGKTIVISSQSTFPFSFVEYLECSSSYSLPLNRVKTMAKLIDDILEARQAEQARSII